MEYTPAEKDLLSILQRTDFKNLSKNDFISYTSKLGEMRPEVAKEILAQFPQLVGLMTSATREYMAALDNIIANEQKNFAMYHETTKQEMNSATESRKQFYDFLKQSHDTYSKCLENPDLSPEERTDILNRLDKLVKMASEKDTEIRNQEREIEDKVNKKDTEKSASNWKIAAACGTAFLGVIGIGASVLGGKFGIKMPTKN